MERKAVGTRHPSRWLSAIWLLGTLAAITISVVAVRLAGEQVTDRHSAFLSRAEVSDAVSEEAGPTTDDSSGPGSGGLDDSSGPGSTDADSSGRASGGLDDGSGSGSGSSGPSGDSGTSDDHGGSSTTVAPSGGSGDGGSSGPEGGSGSDDGGGGSGDGGGSGPGPTTTTTAPLIQIGPFVRITAGGTVTGLCTGDDASLVLVTPTLGWSADIRKRGPQEVEVRFELGGKRTEVKARCINGTVDWR